MKIQTTRVYSELDKAIKAGYTTVSAQGSSRCLGEGTQIRMFDGRLKPVELIIIGDRVMNISGDGYNTVLSTHSGVDKLYKVRQKRGVDYIVNSNHILSLKQTRTQGRKIAIEGFKSAEKREWVYESFNRDKIYDFDIDCFKSQSENFRLRYTGFKNTMCELSEAPLPIDPYYMGMWLGDGCSIRPHEITNIDKEIIDWFYDFAKTLETYAYRIDSVSHRFMICEEGFRNKALKGKTRDFRDRFRNLNLIKNKHIPDIYIYNSYDNRLKLLAGLIDSDGYQTGRNTIAITQKNRKILEGVLEICRLSGFYTNGIIEIGASMKRKDGSVYEGRAYSIEINHSDFKDLNQFIKIPRKRIKDKNCNRNYFSTTITIENAGIGSYYGFELDNSPYFMIEDGTVCHNSSKTYNILIWLIIYCLQHPGTRLSIVRSTLPALKGSVFIDFKEILIKMGIFDEGALNKTDFIYHFSNGSWVEFFSTDSEQKIRGRKRDILYCNEANELKFIEWQQLKMRTTRFSIVDYNPSFSEEHWLCDLNKEKRTYHFISTYLDNPFLEQTIVDEIESLSDKNKSLWQIYGLGLQAQIEGLIFKDITLIDEIDPYIKKRGKGMDFGFTNDPTAIIDCVLDGSNLYLDEQCYKTKMLTGDIIEELKGCEQRIMSESADPRLIQEIANAGILIYPVEKGAGSIMAGITYMLGLKIHVTKRSYNLLKEFKNYTYLQDKNGRWINQPIDKYNHGIDAVRYWILGEILGKIIIAKDIDKDDLYLPL